MLPRAAAAAILIWAPLCLANEPTPDGPMGLRIQGVLRELFLDPILSDARPLEALVIDARYSVANSWNMPMVLGQNGIRASQFFDEQADSLNLKVAMPWSRWAGAGPRIPGSPKGLFERLSTSLEWRLTMHW